MLCYRTSPGILFASVADCSTLLLLELGLVAIADRARAVKVVTYEMSWSSATLVLVVCEMLRSS